MKLINYNGHFYQTINKAPDRDDWYIFQYTTINAYKGIVVSNAPIDTWNAIGTKNWIRTIIASDNLEIGLPGVELDLEDRMSLDIGS